MTNKQKIFLIKLSITISGIFSICAMWMVALIDAMPEVHQSYHKYNEIANYLLAFMFLSTGIMMFLTSHLKIENERTKSEKLKLTYGDYGKLKVHLENKFVDNGYNKLELFQEYPFDIFYTYRKKGEIVNLVMLIRLEEMTEEIYKEYNETRFERLGNYLIKEKHLRKKDSVYMTIIICVDRVNKHFSKYTEKNVQQAIRRYTLPIGVSFGSNTLYIATQEDGMFKGAYVKMKKQFKNYVSDIIIEKNTTNK